MSRFWDWALAAYAKPGVADACLALQDRHGLSVPLLLWTLWRGEAADLPRAGALAESWEAAAGRSLRAARRGLKADLPDLPSAARAALRDRLKALELDGERLLMEALEALPPGAPSASADPAARLAAAARASGVTVGAEVFSPLLACL